MTQTNSLAVHVPCVFLRAGHSQHWVRTKGLYKSQAEEALAEALDIAVEAVELGQHGVYTCD